MNEGQPTNWEPRKQHPEEVADGLRDAFIQAKEDGVIDTTSYLENWGLNIPKQSNWKCYLFGNRPGGNGIMYVPQEGRVPNRFVRFMMRICFDSVWVK